MSHNANYIRLINSWEWQKIRMEKLLKNPTCEMCKKNGKFTIAQQVHHITPVESVTDYQLMRTLAYDMNNLMSLCKQCHKQIHLNMHNKRTHKQVTDDYLERFKKRFMSDNQ